MAPANTPTDHRETALSLLEKANNYAVNSAARIVTLTEAQVHATLALTAATVVNIVQTERVGDVEVTTGETRPVEDAFGTPPVPEVTEALTKEAKYAALDAIADLGDDTTPPVKPRRTRKAPAKPTTEESTK